MNEITHDTFSAIKPRFIELANPETFKKECSFALQHINKNAQLQKATVESKLEAVLNIAQIGLSLNPVLKEAYLVPRWNGQKKQVECHLEPSYQGLIRLVTDTGAVRSMECHLVHENDDFVIAIHTPEKVKHSWGFGDRGAIVGAYSVATLSDGSKHVETMSKQEIEKIRDSSESYKAFKAGKIKSCIWTEHSGEMERKTVIRRHIKYLPRTGEQVGKAIELDEKDFIASDGQLDYIESLLGTANIAPREVDAIEMELATMSAQRASDVIQRLKENQLDPVTQTGKFSQKELNKHLNKISQ